MPIVSSSYVVGHAQVDGRRYVTETHTDDLGTEVIFEYLADVGADYAVSLSARAVQINDALADVEALELSGGA